jgi:hypothetical protein
LEKGIKVEAEHTDDSKIAAEIAKDHLTEDPLYYEKLAKVEGKPNEATPTPPKPDPVINIDEIVEKAVAAAVEKVALQFATKMQEQQIAHDAEVERQKAERESEIQRQKTNQEAEIAEKNKQIEELKRTAPTGVPNQQVHLGTEEMEEAAKHRQFVENYRKGNR